MTTAQVPRPRCRPDVNQVVPTVVGTATLASLVLTSLVLGSPSTLSADGDPLRRAPVVVDEQVTEHPSAHEVTGR